MLPNLGMGMTLYGPLRALRGCYGGPGGVVCARDRPPPDGRPLAIYTDSQYVQKGMTDWIENWKRNGWRSGNKKPVANRDLWETLDASARGRNVDWKWVRGHAGNRGNERADALAQQAAVAAKVHIGKIG